MKNDIKNNEINSITASIESFELELEIMESIVNDAVIEAISNINNLPMGTSFTLEDVLSSDTLAFLKSESQLSNFEAALIKNYFKFNSYGALTNVRATGFVLDNFS